MRGKTMYKKEVVVNNLNGLHAGPITLLIALVSTYKSQIRLLYNGKKINPRSILNIMGASIPSGARIMIIAEGEDEEETVNAIYNLIVELKE